MKDKSLILDLMNSEAGRFLVGEKGKERIVDVSPDSYSKFLGFNKGKPVLKGVFFAGLGRHIEKIFFPIILKQRIASEKYLDRILQDKYKSFLHFAGLERVNYLPQIYLDVTPFNPNTTGDGTIYNDNTSWANCKAATSGIVNNASNFVPLRATGGSPFELGRVFAPTDFAALLGATGVSGTWKVYRDDTDAAFLNADSESLCLIVTTQASATAIAAEDFDNVTLTDKGNLAFASFPADLNYTSEVTITDSTIIPTDGSVKKLGFVGLRDINNSAPTGNNQVGFQNSGQANPVVFTITYTPAPSTNEEIAYFL